MPDAEIAVDLQHGAFNILQLENALHAQHFHQIENGHAHTFHGFLVDFAVCDNDHRFAAEHTPQPQVFHNDNRSDDFKKYQHENGDQPHADRLGKILQGNGRDL